MYVFFVKIKTSRITSRKDETTDAGFSQKSELLSKSEQQQQSSARGDILAMLAGKTAKIWTKKPQLLAFVASLNGNAGSPMCTEGDELD